MDLFSAVFIGLGLVLFAGFAMEVWSFLQHSDVEPRPTRAVRFPIRLLLAAIVPLALGTALSLKVRQLVRNRGSEASALAGDAASPPMTGSAPSSME